MKYSRNTHKIHVQIKWDIVKSWHITAQQIDVGHEHCSPEQFAQNVAVKSTWTRFRTRPRNTVIGRQCEVSEEIIGDRYTMIHNATHMADMAFVHCENCLQAALIARPPAHVSYC